MISDESLRCHNMLMRAVINNDIHDVRLFIPLTDVNYKLGMALRRAVVNGNLDVAQELIPVTDLRRGHSIFLQLASIHGHREILEQLWDGSDATDALQDMEKRLLEMKNSIKHEHFVLINERKKIDDERALLQHTVGHLGGNNRRSKL